MFVAVLSDKPELREEFCKSVGKETSKDDLSFYTADAGGQAITLIEPSHYPEKIQPLLYSLSMADCVVLIVDSINPKVGEIIVALNSLKINRGIIVSSLVLPLAGTVLEKYEKVSGIGAAREKLSSFQRSEQGENAFALVDKSLALKSVGNTAFGVMKSGKIKKNDKLFLLPERKEIELRSVHINGVDCEEVHSGVRFGAAFKGELFTRGMLVPLRNDFQVESIVNGRFAKSPFFKDDLKGKIHAYSNMQFVEGAVTDNDLTLHAPFAFEKGEHILIVDASNQKLRIVGTFQSKW